MRHSILLGLGVRRGNRKAVVVRVKEREKVTRRMGTFVMNGVVSMSMGDTSMPGCSTRAPELFIGYISTLCTRCSHALVCAVDDIVDRYGMGRTRH